MVMKMQEIVEILMRRDGLNELEAWNIVEECVNVMQNAVMRGDYDECEDIMKDFLGLEPDFLPYLMELY